MFSSDSSDTIAAIATPPGLGGIGIVRVSGPESIAIIQEIVNEPLKPRIASYRNFLDSQNRIIDSGIALLFTKPHSFTGEDILELHGHGGAVVLDMVLQRVLELGARLAHPGEFSQRAFLNDKLDLIQAEAIADLISSASEQAARGAIRALQGNFSQQIHQLSNSILELRMYIESAIDFPDEEIEIMEKSDVFARLGKLKSSLENILDSTHQGCLMREGIKVVITGRPNAGKSSLLNALVQRNAAIVTEIPGTTRDVLREYISIDGLPLHVIDTAGLRASEDPIENAGITRAWDEISEADRILLVVDDSRENSSEVIQEIFPSRSTNKLTVIRNKIDLSGNEPAITAQNGITEILLSAETREGIALLQEHLKECVGFQSVGESSFIARRRHLDAIQQALKLTEEAMEQLKSNYASELVAENLRLSQNKLAEITGEVTPDDLLDRIFSSFCIGK